MFTKEHCMKIAKLLKDSRGGKHPPLQFTLFHSRIVQDFVSLFEEDTSKFDVEKFLDVIYGKEVNKHEKR